MQSETPKNLQKHLNRLSRAISPTADSTFEFKGGEVRDVVILFLDIVEFTCLSETLGNPERVYHVISTVFAAFAEIIQKHNGRVEKYIGDAIMAVWGADQVSEFDAEKAVTAALEILASFEPINQVLDSEELKLNARIGINAGTVVFDCNRDGTSNHETRGDWMVVGDTVNTAERIQSAADSSTIWVSSSVRERAGEAFSYIDQGLISVRGKSIPIHVFAVTGKGSGRKLPWERAALVKKSPMVGRESEMEHLIRIFRDNSILGLRDLPKNILICIKGAAGIGKSRLLREFLKRTDASVFYSNSLPFGQYPYAAWQSILQHYFNIGENDPKGDEKFESGFDNLLRNLPKSPWTEEIKSELIRLKPYLSNLSCLQGQTNIINRGNEEATNLEIQMALKFFLEAAGLNSKVILLFEDYHWIDEASSECLQFILKTVSSPNPIIFILAYRPEIELHSNCYPNVIKDEVVLGPIADDDCRSLINYMFEGGVPEEVENFVLQHAEGNPFYLEELLLSLVQKAIIRLENGEWQLVFALTEAEIPHSLNAVILSRFDDLDEVSKTVMRRASVIGQEFSLRILGFMSDRLGGMENSEQTMQRLEAMDFIFRIRGKHDAIYAFKHALTQNVIYDSILHHNRLILHKIAAECYEESTSGGVGGLTEVIAHHWDKANDRVKAIEWGERALNYSLAHYQITSGLKWSITLDEWIGMLGKGTDIEEQNLKLITILKEKAKLQRMAGMLNGLRATLDRVSKLISSELSANQIWLYMNYGLYFTMTGNGDEALNYFQRARDVAETHGDAEDKRLILNHLGIFHITIGKPQQAIKYLNQAIEIDPGKFISPALRGSILGNLALAQVGIGDTAMALNNYQTALQINRGLSNRVSEALNLGNIARVHHLNNNLDEAENCYLSALKIHRETGSFVNEGIILIRLGNIKMDAGDNAQSLVLFKEADKVASQIHNPRLHGLVAEMMGKWFKREDQNDQALNYFEKALAHFREIALPLNTAEILLQIGMLYYEDGKLENAVDCYNQIIEELKKTTIDKEKDTIFVQFRSNLIDKGLLDYSPDL